MDDSQLIALPDNMEQLHTLLLEMQSHIADLETRIEELENGD